MIDNSSFRDNSGFIFYHDNKPHRVIKDSYKKEFDKLVASGLYKNLVDQGYLIPHSELSQNESENIKTEYSFSAIYKIICPQKIPFISYPYEWNFTQLKDAAVLTLKIQELALKYGMTLKDASAFNIQFIGSSPIFIDTLSFEDYKEGEPWIAYRQFCQHFLAPLALNKYGVTELTKLRQCFIDGLPLNVVSKILPWRSKLNAFLMIHLHYHAKLGNKYASNHQPSALKKMKLSLSKNKLIGIIQHLLSGINSMELKISKTEWTNYYEEFSYHDDAFEEKKKTISNWIDKIKPKTTWDLGCNTGIFSDIASQHSKYTISFDKDFFALEKYSRTLNNDKILTLLLDIDNPTSSAGWANEERKSLMQRGPADLILALALIHHLAISNNVPLNKIADFCSKCSEYLIIEFIPKQDEQVQRLLSNRNDIFANYNEGEFIKAFSNHYKIIERHTIKGTDRIIFLMQKV